MKIDLHRHHGGSISPNIVTRLLNAQGNDVSLEQIERTMLFEEGESYGFQAFMDKFEPLNDVEWTEEAIATCTEQIVWDIAAEKIDYAEIHLTIDKYLRQSWDPSKIVSFISREFKKQAEMWDVSISLVLSLKYESDRDMQRKVSDLIDDSAEYISGLNLVGDEKFYDADFYVPIFKHWKQAGKGLIAHVGESQGVENVKSAILDLNVDRIAHGIRVADHPDIIELAKERNVCFDIALTSNLLTGVVEDIKAHPIARMIDQGCTVSVGTDDPVICDTTLDIEYNILTTELDFSDRQILEIMRNSVLYAFDIDEDTKRFYSNFYPSRQR